MVLTAITAAPALLVAGAFLHHQGNRQLRKQRETAAQLRQADSELQTMSQQWGAIRARSEAVREVLDRLVAASAPRLAWLEGKVAQDNDYRSYSSEDRSRLAAVVALATTTITVMKANLFDDKMLVTKIGEEVVTAANSHLDQLNQEPPLDLAHA